MKTRNSLRYFVTDSRLAIISTDLNVYWKEKIALFDSSHRKVCRLSKIVLSLFLMFYKDLLYERS